MRSRGDLLQATSGITVNGKRREIGLGADPKRLVKTASTATATATAATRLVDRQPANQTGFHLQRVDPT